MDKDARSRSNSFMDRLLINNRTGTLPYWPWPLIVARILLDGSAASVYFYLRNRKDFIDTFAE